MGQTNQVVTMYLERVGVIENDVKSTTKRSQVMSVAAKILLSSSITTHQDARNRLVLQVYMC